MPATSGGESHSRDGVLTAEWGQNHDCQPTAPLNCREGLPAGAFAKHVAVGAPSFNYRRLEAGEYPGAKDRAHVVEAAGRELSAHPGRWHRIL